MNDTDENTDQDGLTQEACTKQEDRLRPSLEELRHTPVEENNSEKKKTQEEAEDKSGRGGGQMGRHCGEVNIDVTER